MKTSENPGATGKQTLYDQIAEHVKSQIRGGVFPPGQKLPSVRSLSASQRVSISTVQEAYRRLEDEQWIVARPQSGFFVAHKLPGAVAGDSASEPHKGVVRYMQQSGTASALAYRDDLIPFGAAVSDAAFFPCRRLAKGLSDVVRKAPHQLGVYNFAPGSPELRQQVARRAVAWNAQVDPRRVVITNGAVEAVNLCLKAVTQPGDTVAVEAPAYYGFLQVLHSLGLKPLPVLTSGRTGLDVDQLEIIVRSRSVAAVLLSTTVSNPSGGTMPLPRKRQLVELANQCAIPVIEDATFADLHFEGDSACAQGLDRSGIVMLCASLTKTVAPGMRIGWVDAGKFSEQVCYLKRVTSIGQPKAFELALADYLESGGLSVHLRRMRRQMQAQVYRMAEGVQQYFPAGTSFELPTGGFLLWVRLPDNVDAVALQERAVETGVGVAPGLLFSPHGDFRNHIRLNCGIQDASTMRDGLSRLGQLVERMLAEV